VHFLVPARVGGGWDQTARAVADAMTRSGLVDSATLEHVSGGGGAQAISYLLRTGATQPQTLMVSSTPIVLRAVRGATPSYKELQPIAAVIGDYSVIAVRANGPYRDFQSIVDTFRREPSRVRIAGDSLRGGMDHVLSALIFAPAAGVDPRQTVYLPYDAGGNAVTALLTDQVNVLSTGLGELMGSPQAQDIRILAVTAPERVPEAPNLPTLRELGHDVTFINWRGFFGAPQMPTATADAHAVLLGRMIETPVWEETRARYAWQTLYRPRAEFAAFLAQQEATAKRVLTDLGVI
jgi:putative tricarboxylic transport membrane protein